MMGLAGILSDAEYKRGPSDPVWDTLVEVLLHRVEQPLTRTNPVDFVLSGRMADWYNAGIDDLQLLGKCAEFYYTTCNKISKLPLQDQPAALSAISHLVVDVARSVAVVAEQRADRVSLIRLRAESLETTLIDANSELDG